LRIHWIQRCPYLAAITRHIRSVLSNQRRTPEGVIRIRSARARSVTAAHPDSMISGIAVSVTRWPPGRRSEGPFAKSINVD
jgi:hypothetical protein